MHETQVSYDLGLQVTISSQRSTYSGKTGTIRGILCAGQPDGEHYLVHIDGDHDSTRVYHFSAEEIAPVDIKSIEPGRYR